MGLYTIVREYWELGGKGEDSWEWECDHSSQVYPLISRNIQVLGLTIDWLESALRIEKLIP